MMWGRSSVRIFWIAVTLVLALVVGCAKVRPEEKLAILDLRDLYETRALRLTTHGKPYLLPWGTRVAKLTPQVYMIKYACRSFIYGAPSYCRVFAGIAVVELQAGHVYKIKCKGWNGWIEDKTTEEVIPGETLWRGKKLPGFCSTGSLPLQLPNWDYQ